MPIRPRSILDLPDESVSFTNREREILELLARRHSNKLIAAALEIEVATVKNHVNGLLKKLRRWCDGSRDLMVWAFQHPEAVRTGFTRRPAMHPQDCECSNGVCSELRNMAVWQEAA